MDRTVISRTTRTDNIVALVVAIVVGGATVLASLHPGPEERADLWWLVLSVLFAPAFLGSVLVGGVHGGAPIWVVVASMCASNGAVWGLLARALTRILTRPRNPGT
jgi:hypothetical protein